jgi:hypothetical protein
MARLTARARAKIPSKQFAGPGRSFPINDPTHARLAIPMAKKSRNAGNISSGTMEAIISRAKAKLGRR